MIDWQEVQKSLYPIKDYEDICKRLSVSFSFLFVRETFNFSLTELEHYTHKLLGGDARGRYTEYEAWLSNIMTRLHQAGVKNVLNLIERTASRPKLEEFTFQTGFPAPDIVTLLKYLIYWLIPGEKYLSGLVTKDDLNLSNAIKELGGAGIRTNLELLQQGITPAERTALAKASGLSLTVISELVNRADFSRMPWASKATISNIIGAGYVSLAQLANANPEQLYEDFFRYGKSIGKNLKLGNEIENSYRIAKIVPILLENG